MGNKRKVSTESLNGSSLKKIMTVRVQQYINLFHHVASTHRLVNDGMAKQDPRSDTALYESE